jgi:hypothetical protein
MESERIKIAHFGRDPVINKHAFQRLIVVKNGPVVTAANGTTYVWKDDKVYMYNPRLKLMQVSDPAAYYPSKMHAVIVPEDGRERTYDHTTNKFVEHDPVNT